MLSPEQIKDVGAAAVTELYKEPDDDLALELGLPTSEFYGRPLIEVMLVRQARNAARTGDKDEVEAILDRRLGKPKATVESHSTTETYEQYLERIGKAEEDDRRRNAIDVTPRPDPSDIASLL